MARFMPINWRTRKDRYTEVKIPKGRKVTDKDIKSYTEGTYHYFYLLSGDTLYYNTIFQEAAVKANRNEIASAIAGIDLYGPVLLIEQGELL